MDWLKVLITKNIQLLLLLNLDFCPNHKDIDRVRDIWVYAFKKSIGRIDEGLDAPRIQAAFTESFHTLEKWPAPATIINMMPRRPEVKRIEQQHCEDPIEEGTLNKMLEDILGGKTIGGNYE